MNSISWKTVRPIVSAVAHVVAIYLAVRIEESRVIAWLFTHAFDMTEFMELLFPFTIMSVILLIGIGIIVKRQPLSQRPVNKIASAVFACFMLMGHCYSSMEAFFVIFRYLLTAWLGLCYIAGFYLIFRHIFSMLETNLPKMSLRFFHKNIFLRSWLCMFVCWLPYILIRYPAGFEWDAYHQLQQALGIEPLMARWPLASTALIGAWVKAGFAAFHSYEAGALMFVLFQTAVSISVLSYSLVFLNQVEVLPKWCAMVLIGYCLIPFFPAYFTSIVKDSLFSIAVLLDLILMARKLLLHSRGGIGILLTSTAMCLLRNNGIHIVLFWLVVILAYLLIKKNREFLSVAIAMAVTAALYGMYEHVLIPYLHVEKNTTQETLSIPFQQTARYLRDHPDDVSQEEKEVIGRVLDVNTIAERYFPLLSDPVKGTFHASKEDMLPYFSVWFRLFLRHPITYLDAAFHTCYGFFYPDAKQAWNLLPGFYMTTRSDDVLILKEPEALWPWKRSMVRYGEFWEQCPVTFAFYNIPIQMWVALWLVIDCMKKRSMEALVLVMPTIVGILVCAASPTWWNNGFRYALPIACTNPLLLALTTRSECGRNDERLLKAR